MCKFVGKRDPDSNGGPDWLTVYCESHGTLAVMVAPSDDDYRAIATIKHSTIRTMEDHYRANGVNVRYDILTNTWVAR